MCFVAENVGVGDGDGPVNEAALNSEMFSFKRSFHHVFRSLASLAVVLNPSFLHFRRPLDPPGAQKVCFSSGFIRYFECAHVCSLLAQFLKNN